MLNYEELTMESDIFEKIRDDFDLLFQKLFRKMEVSQSEEGSIDLKINIEMQEDTIPQDDGGVKRIAKPVLKHKISTVVPVKDSTEGKKDTGMELVYDADLKRYVLKYVSTGGQMNIWDMQEQEQNNDTAQEEVPAIEQKGYFLPDNGSNTDDEENIIDVEENAPTDEEESTEPLPFSDDGEEDGGFPDSYDYDEPEEE